MTLSHEDIRKERQALHLTIKQAIERLAVLDQMEQELPAETERTEEFDIDVSQFKDTTNRLLTEFLNAPNQMLSQEDIRQDVILDEFASENAVMIVITKARNEMSDCCDCHYEIRNMKRRGYKLVRKESFPNLSKTQKTPRNKRKKRRKG